mmetsp:Transcript_110958/g.312828  ORF Transcript_110958/g.312828 Transcript_110958/m.312828 type:complete len:504 (+) Transcript_110958:3-1514(+)
MLERPGAGMGYFRAMDGVRGAWDGENALDFEAAPRAPGPMRLPMLLGAAPARPHVAKAPAPGEPWKVPLQPTWPKSSGLCFGELLLGVAGEEQRQQQWQRRQQGTSPGTRDAGIATDGAKVTIVCLNDALSVDEAPRIPPTVWSPQPRSQSSTDARSPSKQSAGVEQGGCADVARRYGAPGMAVLQEKIRSADEQELPELFEMIMPDAIDMACDESGRAVLEALLEVSSREWRLLFADRLRGAVSRLTVDIHGCWVVQKVLELLPCDAQIRLMGELSENIEECIESKHGNFVVQACVEQLPPDALTFIVTAVERRAKHFAMHRYGCRVVQRIVEHCSAAQVVLLLNQIVDASLELSRHQYGCHVLRCALEHGQREHKLRIMEAMRLNLPQLSRNRLSSLVLEKCLEVANGGQHAMFLQDERSAFIRAVFDTSKADKNSRTPLMQMASTRFGRGILRRLVESAPPAEREALRRVVNEALPNSRVAAFSAAATSTSARHGSEEAA